MSKPAVFTMKLEADLRDDFMAAAQATHRPASQVVRELMREFIRREQERHDDAAFVHAKVAAARAARHAGPGRANEVVEAEYAARRARLRDGVGDARSNDLA